MDKKEIVRCLDEYAIYHAKGDLPYSARTLTALQEAVSLINEEIKKEESQSMSAEEFAEIFLKGWPALFKLIYDSCELVYKDRHNIEVEDIYLEYGEAALMTTRAILADYGRSEARKIGRLLVDATE